MANWLVILILFLGLVIFGIPNPGGLPPGTSGPILVNGHVGVILEVDESWTTAEGWTPDMEHLQAAEEALDDYDTGALSPEPRMDATRQYIGMVIDGQRHIHINAFCDDQPNWETELVLVLDGGGCFWQAGYNVETGDITGFSVNGHA